MPYEKADFLKKPVEHIDITSFKIDLSPMKNMSLSAGDACRAAEILEHMIDDKSCTNILCIAGSTSAAGCMKVYSDMVRYNMVDAVVATGAAIVDMDFFEALGFRHYRGSPNVNDAVLKQLGIDRIYDTFIDEDELRICDNTIKELADLLEPRPYSSREFIWKMGEYLRENSRKAGSLVQTAYEKNVPVFCPAFSDSSAGFGLGMHQQEKIEKRELYVSIDSVADFRELTGIKMKSQNTGLFMVGGGAPKNFAQDAVVCAELLGAKVPMHKYAVQITVADSRDGACSGSTLSEAESWGKVDASSGESQMVFSEATLVLPLIVSHVYHRNRGIKRPARNWSNIF